MASLRDLADRALQRSRQDGTADGTRVEQAEQGDTLPLDGSHSICSGR